MMIHVLFAKENFLKILDVNLLSSQNKTLVFKFNFMNNL